MEHTRIDDRLDSITEQAIAGDVEGALRGLEALLRTAPQSGEGWLTLATIFSSASRWAEAHHAFARAAALAPASAKTFAAWARTLEKLDRLPEAAEKFQRAHELAPDDAPHLRELGVVLYRAGRYDEARVALERAAQKAPRDPRVAYAIGLCEEARRHPALAIAAYRAATALDPKFTTAHKTLADLLASVGELEQAISVLDGVLRVERTNEQIAHNRDVLARALGEMHARRLLGKSERAWARSALVEEGQLKKIAWSDGGALRFASRLVALHLTLNPASAVTESTLVLLDPQKAARKRDTAFKVTVISERGEPRAADFATAVSLTFLREALGVPLTQASQIYQRALGGERELLVGGARVAFQTIDLSADGQTGHGLTVRLAGAETSR